jgi:U3 small nucleolar RNA-associated protein MPP10
MMNPKEWQLTGEARAAERPKDSLLEVHLDFNTASKLPPVITKETTNAIEALIKQRVLDELFDDPVLKQGSSKRRKLDEKEIDFTKSKTGLGDIYGEELKNRLMVSNPEAFLEAELAGPDAPLKREIEEISKDLFANLDTLSNMHFTPKVARTENAISTQNVPSLLLEDALPI